MACLARNCRGTSYISVMNRRRFLQSLAAVFSLPAMPAVSLAPATAAVPTAAAVPANARFWAIYMSGLHGECTPQTLQNLLHIPEIDARRYISQLISDGVIKPNPLLQRSVSQIMKRNRDSLMDKVSERLEMKERAGSTGVEIPRSDDEAGCRDDEPQVSEKGPQDEPEISAEDQSPEPKTSVPGGIESRG